MASVGEATPSKKLTSTAILPLHGALL